MREIKFRAWKKPLDREDMCLNEKEYKDVAKVISINSENNNAYETTLDNLEIMQYTGLHDKNKKDIFEDDIIKEILPDDEAYTFIVDWNKISASFVLKEIGVPDYYGRFNDDMESSDFEIIGNTFENPELLRIHYLNE